MFKRIRTKCVNSGTDLTLGCQILTNKYKNTYLIATIMRMSMSVDHPILFSHLKELPIHPTLFGPYNQKEHLDVAN